MDSAIPVFSTTRDATTPTPGERLSGHNTGLRARFANASRLRCAGCHSSRPPGSAAHAPPRLGLALPGPWLTVRPDSCHRRLADDCALMSTKRKASEPGGAAGKRRAADDATETIEGGDDLLGIIDGLGGDEGNENDEDALQSAFENDADGLGDALGDDLEGQIEAGVDGIEEGDLGESEIADDDDAPQSEVGDDAASEADEDVLLPSGLEESELKTATEVDLSKLDISAAQARKIAPLLCANEALTTIRCEGGRPRAPSLSPSASP